MGINLRKTVNKDALKAKFEQDSSGGGQTGTDFLPYFKLKNKDSLTLRFLSDANPDNQDFFTYVEEIFNFNGKNMKFDGPSKDCPASKIAAERFAEVKALGENTEEGKAMRDKAMKFYKKKKYLANCYIVDAPDYWWGAVGLDAEKIVDRVKICSLPSKVYDKIKDTVLDDEYADVEFYNFGDSVVNFKFTLKQNTGGHNDYTASKFEIKPKELDVSDDEIDAIAECLKDLSKVFKAHSLEDFQEAIDIELAAEDGDDSGSPKPKGKPATKNTKSDEDDEAGDEEPVVKKPAVNTKAQDPEEYDTEAGEDDGEPIITKPTAKAKAQDPEEYDNEAGEDAGDKKDIKSLRASILGKVNKLK